MSIDTQIRVPVGPALVPLRSLSVLAAFAPLALVVLAQASIPLTYRVGLTMSVLLAAFGLSVPDREGVWILTWWVYRLAAPFLPTVILDGKPSRARVGSVAGATRIGVAHRRALEHALQAFHVAERLTVPRVATTGNGIIRLAPGGARAVLMVLAPAASVGSSRYEEWCDRMVQWLLALDCPSQLLTLLDHYDRMQAEVAFDRRVKGWPQSPLAAFERDLAGNVAEQSLRFRNYVVLSPGIAGADGVPAASRFLGRSAVRSATDDEADRVLRTALRLASGLGLDVGVADRDDMAALVDRTVLGARSAAVTHDGVVRVGDSLSQVSTSLRLPSTIQPGLVVEALMRARIQGAASLHVLPVASDVARRLLDRRVSMHRYSAREGNSAVDNQVALAETNAVLASIAQREIKPCRMALTLAIRDVTRERLEATTQRMEALLSSCGLSMTRVSSPGLVVALAVAPGCAPLRRSLQITSDDVVACMLPALGTPFSDQREPLLGLSLATGAPVYASVWSRPNFNALILGSSGAGKSVATKTLLIRHLMEGAVAVVIDPDSEYRRLMNAVGGRHFELGDEALNVLAIGSRESADVAASAVLPVLSVMAGDERGFRDGRPIRRMPDEDQGWLHGELADFFRSWRDYPAGGEPLLHDLVKFLERSFACSPLTPRETDRFRVVIARLRRFTQGHRAQVFDRPSTFTVGDEPVAVGLRSFALSYAADLTPALAVVLTAVMSALGRGTVRRIIVVDEAHRVTADPDAGDVLAQLVRQARKHATGVWMCSQRVEDFIATDLGRTLAATASTKLLLGAEEPCVAGVKEAFSLDDEETSAISPIVQGRGVLISAGERSLVTVLPGRAILALADTTPSAVGSLLPAAAE